MRSILQIVCFACAFALGSTHAATSFQYASQPGDYVGQGAQGSFDAPGTTITANGYPSSVQLTAWGPSYFSIHFESPSGQPLAVGTYARAERFPAADHAGLDVAGNGRGCNQSFGHFTILEIAFDSSNNLASFAADFEQHCEGDEPALYGGVRYNSSIPYVAQPPVPYVPASIQIVSQPGDFIGAGQSRTLTRADGLFYTQPDYGTGAQVRLQSLAGAPYEFWMLNFAPAAGQPFGPGTYESAERYPFMSPGHPGLAVVGEGRGCNSSTGRFTVYEVEYGPLQTLTKFAADFEQHCEGVTPALFGAVRYNSIIPYGGPPIPATLSLDSTDFSLPVGVVIAGPVARVLNANGNPVQFARVRFTIADCGSLAGAQSVDVITGADGYAPSPQFFAPGTPAVCNVLVTLPDASSVPAASVRFRVFAPASLGNVQDMWWSGAAGNGWGMSIIEHGDTLFSVLFVYDAQGDPTWLAMPGGTWNPARDAYTGALYRPRGSSFASYDVSRFAAGDSVGSATISFSSADFATLRYTIDGVTGFKLIERQRFGPVTGGNGPHADMWWGGPAQNGWGLAVLEQSPSLFPIWYTYDASGSPRWFVMPVGAWSSSNAYEGRIYRTTGSPWLGRDYDPAQLRASDAGSFALRFDGDGARFDYSIDGVSGSIPLVRQPF